MALTKLTVKKKNRDTVASVKEVFNTNRISGLIASGSDAVFYYTENVNGDRYAPDEYTVDETVATISGKWTGEDAIPISLPVLKKKVDGNEITYVKSVVEEVSKIARIWANPTDATQSYVLCYPSPFRPVRYLVDLSVDQLNGIANILTFTFLDAGNSGITGGNCAGTIDYDAGTIAVTVPAGSTVTALIATFTLSTGAVAKISSTTQVSGTTANNFTSPQTYVVTGADNSTKNFVVTVTIAS